MYEFIPSNSRDTICYKAYMASPLYLDSRISTMVRLIMATRCLRLVLQMYEFIPSNSRDTICYKAYMASPLYLDSRISTMVRLIMATRCLRLAVVTSSSN